MSTTTRTPAQPASRVRPITTAVAVGAKAVLLVSLGVAVVRSPVLPAALVIVAAALLVGGFLAWWRWRARMPLVIVDLLYALTGAMAMSRSEWTALPAGAVEDRAWFWITSAWVFAGTIGAVAVWRARR